MDTEDDFCLSQRAVEAALTKFNEVINDPIMEPCPRCEGKGYHHGFGPDGVSPDWCNDCGGSQYNIRPGEEKRAMEAALTAALAVDGMALVPKEPTEDMLDFGACYEDPDGLYQNHSIFKDGDISRDVYRAMVEAASREFPPPPAASDREERTSQDKP